MTEAETVPTTSLDVSLPEPLRAYAQERVAEGAYPSLSDYVRALIVEHMRRREEERVDALLLEGLNSGPAEPFTRADWDGIRAEAERRAARLTIPAA